MVTDDVGRPRRVSSSSVRPCSESAPRQPRSWAAGCVRRRRLRRPAAASPFLVRQRPGRHRPPSRSTVPGLSPYITPNTDFYRIDTALVVPQVDVETWRLDDHRAGRSAVLDSPTTSCSRWTPSRRPSRSQCVSNEVGGDLVGNAVWQGVPLAALLERAGVQAEATQIVGRSVDGFDGRVPHRRRPRRAHVALVAYAMNGEPLPDAARLPGPARRRRAVRLRLGDQVAARDRADDMGRASTAYWISRGWAKDGPIKTQSRIDVPRGGDHLAAGPTADRRRRMGARPRHRAVEVQRRRRRMAAVPARRRRQREHLGAVAVRLGRHARRPRRSASGPSTATATMQTGDIASPAPDGATGWHTRRVRVDG